MTTITNAPDHDLVDPRAAEGGSENLPPLPEASSAMLARRTKWWDLTDTNERYKRALARWDVAHRALMPHRKGVRAAETQSYDVRTDADHREVHVPYIYRSTATTTAMTVPDDHSARWRPSRQVTPMDAAQRPIGADPVHKQFAESVEVVTEQLLQEADHQETCESWVQDGASFGMSVLKVTWRREHASDWLTDLAGKDEDENRDRLRWLHEQALLGRIHESSDEWKEMWSLEDALGGKSELRSYEGLGLENLPLWAFAFDPTVTDSSRIYKAEWMRHDVLMSRIAVGAKFPFKVLELRADGSPARWTGIHPDHLESASCYQSDGVRRPREVQSAIDERRNARATTGANSGNPDDDLLLVREVWLKRENKVLWMVAGVPYVVAEIVPERQPFQWYPFVVLVPNRVPGDPYGASDTELMRDIQDRINKKHTDEEKARWNSIGRGYYNEQEIDATEAEKFHNHPPGEMRGIKIRGDDLAKNVAYIAQPYVREAYDRNEDMRDLRQMAALPEQAQGVTGNADYAAEVNAAMQGAAIMVRARQAKVRRALERLRKAVAEIALQEMSPETAKQMGGDEVLWPRVYGDDEAAQLREMADREAQNMAMIDVGMAVRQMAEEAAANGQAITEDQLMQEAQALYQQSLEQARAAAYMKHFGWEEPLTREALYRRIRVRVHVSMDGQLDRDRRIQNLTTLLDVMVKMGIMLPKEPIIRILANLLGEDDDLDEMMVEDPNELVVRAFRALQEHPEMVDQETMQNVKDFVASVSQMIAAAGGDPTNPDAPADDAGATAQQEPAA